MPRTLPWFTGAKATTKASTSSPIPAKRKRTPPSDEDLVDADLNPTNSTPTRRPKCDAVRSPSSSPPLAPPSAEPMRPGYAADDVWMMVEDEFFATAQLYTQHLHHAAYAKAKRAARARGEKTLRGIKRATDGRTDMGVATRLQLERRATAKMSDEGEEDKVIEDDWAIDGQLAGLMNAGEVQMAGRELKGLGKVRSDTRASKGYLRSPEKAKKWSEINPVRVKEENIKEEDNEGDESDDLDRPVRVESEPREHARPAVTSRKDPTRSALSRQSTDSEIFGPRKFSGIFKQCAEPVPSVKKESDMTIKKEAPEPSLKRPDKRNDARKRNGEASKPKVTPILDDLDGAIDTPARPTAAEYMAKRKADRERKDKAEQSTGKDMARKEYDDVPTFAFC